MINVNGKDMEVPIILREVSLLVFLRDFAGFTGTKYGCGAGLCGACMVHLDGEAITSCQYLVSDVLNRRITTIEGLADTVSTEDLHPLQKAWIEFSVPQCGYCQAGQIMAAAAILSKTAEPSLDDIRTGMAGNLCRCGTYKRIQKAILKASEEMSNDKK